MSPRSGKALRAIALLAGLTLLAACGSSGTRPAEPGGATTADASREARAAQARADSRRAADASGDAAAVDETGEVATGVPAEIPPAALALHEEGVAALRAGDWLEAELVLERLVAEFPDYPGPYVNLAIVHREAGREDEALAALERALALAPAHPAANNELGVIRRGQGEFDAAEAAYRQALSGDPDYALAHYNLGVLLDLYLRREAEALEHYEAYQSLVESPDDEVGRWVVDLRRRLGMPAETARVAREGGP